MINKYLCN